MSGFCPKEKRHGGLLRKTNGRASKRLKSETTLTISAKLKFRANHPKRVVRRMCGLLIGEKDLFSPK